MPKSTSGSFSPCWLHYSGARSLTSNALVPPSTVRLFPCLAQAFSQSRSAFRVKPAPLRAVTTGRAYRGGRQQGCVSLEPSQGHRADTPAEAARQGGRQLKDWSVVNKAPG